LRNERITINDEYDTFKAIAIHCFDR
jgi:hypothetical protein